MQQQLDKAVSAFLNRGSLDCQDLIAKRAIRAIFGLIDLRQNAYDRGSRSGFNECSRGLDCAVTAFACINTEKRYDFAAKVHPSVKDLTEALLDLHKPSQKAEGLLNQAEAALRALKDVLTPVCTVHGINSVAILRGDHCVATMAGIKFANDNEGRRPAHGG
jgi:hypothetical protein